MIAQRNNEIRLERRGPDLEEVYARGESVGMIQRFRVGGFTGWRVDWGEGWQELEGAAHEVKGTAILALVKRHLKRERQAERQAALVGVEVGR